MNTSSTLHILGISGSLRKGSWNSGLLRAALKLLPPNTTLEIYDIGPIPMFNQDLIVAERGVERMPELVQHFQSHITAADALLIATPEYNYSTTGVLKNAIDWASRPPQTSSLNNKPVALMGAGGRMGTSRAQYHLRQIAVYNNMHVLTQPEVFVAGRDKFDAEGNLMDDSVRQEIRALLVALQAWTLRLRE